MKISCGDAPPENLARRRPEHAATRATEMGRIRETGPVVDPLDLFYRLLTHHKPSGWLPAVI
jgi:hypothetical protein